MRSTFGRRGFILKVLFLDIMLYHLPIENIMQYLMLRHVIHHYIMLHHFTSFYIILPHVTSCCNLQIENRRLTWNASSKVWSLDILKFSFVTTSSKQETHLPHLIFFNMKVGSLGDHTKHRAGGGDKKIESRKLEWNVTSKVGSRTSQMLSSYNHATFITNVVKL